MTSLRFLSLALVAAASAATSGTFDILSMNVAGLPAIFNGNDVPGDKASNAGIIGQKFAEYGYDIIHVQEDFNYHAYIYATDTHPYRTATSGGAGFGSGLNTLSNFLGIDFERTKWETCSDASSSDCLTPKGYTFQRVQVDSGVYVDTYNLHTDAGTEDDDERARNSNLKQVADAIDSQSQGNAVLVFGDTNSRYTRTADDISVFERQNGMTDVWLHLVRDDVVPTVETICDNPSNTSYCETVDKIFFRGSPLLSLKAVSFAYASEKFLQPDGNILSDHNPVSAVFNWSVSDTLRQSDFWGGPHGTWFSDVPSLDTMTNRKAATLTFRGASRVDFVGVTLNDGTSLSHGGGGGDESHLILAESEYWVSAELCQGQKSGHTRIFYILATTNKGRTVSAGTVTDDCSTFTAPSGWQIVGFLGRDGDEVDRLGFIFAPQ